MDFLNGVYKVIYIKVAAVWTPVGCLTDNSFTESVDMLPTTTRDNTGGWDSSIPTKQRYNINFSGLLLIGDRGGVILTHDDLTTYKRSRTKLEWKIESAVGGNVQEGFCYITNLSDSATIDEFETFTCDMVGWNAPTTIIGNAYIDNDYYEDYYI